VAHVYDALERPDEIYEDVENGAMVALRRVDDRSVVVIYRSEGDKVKVITLYYANKIERLVKSKVARGAWRRAG